MRACSTAGGGVMFVPDTLERKGAAISYSDLLEEKKAKPLKNFGKRRTIKRPLRKAA
jgi:hypothetical protein